MTKQEAIMAFPVGSRVRSRVGCRFNGPGRLYGAEVVGHGMWRDFPQLRVKIADGTYTTILAKNAAVIEPAIDHRALLGKVLRTHKKTDPMGALLTALQLDLSAAEWDELQAIARGESE